MFTGRTMEFIKFTGHSNDSITWRLHNVYWSYYGVYTVFTGHTMECTHHLFILWSVYCLQVIIYM